MKLKRLFTAILSAALTLSLCAMPAMAAGTGTTGTASKTPTAIDWNQKGKLTIHKYETDTTPTGTRDNGESTVTDGKPLNGVTFTLYQVKDKEWLKSYYQGTYTGTPTAMPKVSDYTIKSDGTVQNGSNIFTAADTVITGDPSKHWDAGTAVASGLDLGLYLVVETDKPDAVKETTEPFLVSIPMTSVDTTNWLYDVTVNPKNVTKYGAATLKKVGYTGSNPDGTVMSGYTFKLYKWNGAEWKWITKKPLNGQDNMGPDLGALTTNNSGEISVSGLTQGVYAFVETGVNREQGYILDDETAYVFTLDANGAMQKATDSDVASTATSFDGAVKTLNYDCVKSTTAGTNNLEVINYKPDIVKTVTKRDGTTNKHEADYGVDDAVPYTLTIKVPENITSLKTFTVTDTTLKAQLIQKQSSVHVSGKKKDGDVATLDEGAYIITVKPDGDNSVMTVAFTPSSLADVAGGEITIAYTATVQATAAVAGDGNVNTAKIFYSRKTNLTEETGNNKPYEITDMGVVYTFGLNIHKIAKGGTKDTQGLVGVTFDLYKKVELYEMEGSNVKTTIRNTEYTDSNLCADAVKLGLAANNTEKWIKIETLTTGENGYVSAKGLPSGTYKLVETKTVEGYNLLSKPVDAKLNLTYAAGWTTTTQYDNGNLTKSTITTPTYKRDGAIVADPSAVIEIVNRAGFTLPVTGGFGTLLFSGIGLLLVLVGVSVLFSLKKRTNRA